MTESAATQTRRPRWGLVWAGFLLAAAVFVVVSVVVQQHRDRDRMSDEFYCTLSGVSVFDRAPHTHRLCGDLLRNP